MPVKSFRGQIKDDSVDIITLHTNTGSTGYRIVKFEVISQSPVDITAESVLQIYKVPQTTTTPDIDFSDQTLLAAGYLEGNASNQYTDGSNVIFDSEVFNQDITLTSIDNDGDTEEVNYYMELEQVKLDLNQNTMATLKDIKNIEQRSQI